MGWAERVNPKSRYNRRRPAGGYAPYPTPVVPFMSKAQLVAARAIKKFLGLFRRAA